MTLPDLTSYTEDELRTLQVLAAQRITALEQEAAAQAAALGADIKGSIDALTALIGPDAPTTASTNNLAEVQLYTNAQMAANAGLAHRLTFVALERLARTVRDIARAKTEG